MEKVVLKIGGSVLSPSLDKLFDFETAYKIRDALLTLKDKYQFIINTGGGTICKMYQKMVREQGGTERDINWIGTETCSLNAVMMRIVLGDDCEDVPLTGQIIKSDEPINIRKTFLTVGAADPGHSSDYDAVIVAKRTGAKTIISLKNVDGVYSDDPRINPAAKRYDKLSWQEYKDIIKVEEFKPKMALPVDPIATKHAIEMGLRFIIIDGSNIPNILKAIEGKDFIGTVIG